MNKPSPHYAAISLIVAICLSIFAISAYLMIQGRRGVAFAAVGASFSLIAWFRNRKEVSPLCLLPAFLLVIFYTCRAFLLDKAGPSGMLPTYDIFALFVDGKFGFQPSIWVRQVICRSHFGELVLQNTYEGLPAVLGLAYALNIGAQNRHWRVFGLFLLTAIVGTQCYRLLPICGPAYLPFGDECFYFHGSCSTDAMLS